MADNEKLQAELQVLRADNAQLKDELQKLTATQSEKSVFQTLNEYDISEHLKKKDKIMLFSAAQLEISILIELS